MRKYLTMRQALEAPDLFAGENGIGGETWAAWRPLLLAIVGEELTPAEREVYTALTKREREPDGPVDEFWGVIGRRGGKSRAMAHLAAYLAAIVDHRAVLAPGERGVIPVIAQTTDQAQQLFNFILGVFEASPRLARRVEGDPVNGEVRLNTRVDIRVMPASFRTGRSFTAVAVIADEVAFWRSSESKNPDAEILNALRPSLATTGGPLIVISSPHAKRGELWENFKAHHRPDGDPLILVANAPSRTMNPSLSQAKVDRAYARDPSKASAEYGGRFRDDVEDFLSPADLDRVVVPGRELLPRASGVTYFGFVDPSGGRNDSMTLSIAHLDGDKAVLDVMHEAEPPFSTDDVTKQFCATLKDYGLTKVTGDNYGGEWPKERFRTHGVEYERSKLPRSEIYRAFLPLLTSGRVELCDNPKMKAQFCALERTVNKGGRDSINHPAGAHDDLCNAAAGALCLASEGKSGFDSSYSWVTDDDAGALSFMGGGDRALLNMMYRYKTTA